MARPFFPNEADDPDLDWLVSNFLYERPDFLPVETGMLPLVLIPFSEGKGERQGNRALVGATDVPAEDTE